MIDVAGFKKERRAAGVPAAVAGVRKVRTIVAAPATVAVHYQGNDPIRAILGNGGTIARGIPNYRERDRQLNLSSFVADCISGRKHGLGEAGTGVGKSYAYLVPAILSGLQTIVAVPTIALQTQLIEKDLPALARPGIMPRHFTYALLKGRRNYACRLKADRYLSGETFRDDDATLSGQDVEELTTWYRTTTDGDIGKLSIQLPMAVRNEITADSDECLGESCPVFESCYGESAKARAKAADIIVTNYAMLMLDMRLRSMSGDAVSLTPNASVRIFDECHRVPNVARDAFTIEVTEGRWLYLSRRIRRQLATIIPGKDDEVTPAVVDAWRAGLGAIDGEVRDLFADYGDRIKSSREKETAIRLGDEMEALHDVMVTLHKFRVAMLQAAPSGLEGDARKSWDKAAETLGELIGDFWSIAQPRETLEYVATAEIETDGEREKVVLSLVPVDVAPILRENLYGRGGTTISVSATVTEGGSFDYYREQVGLDDCVTIDVGSMFDYRRDTLLYIPAEPKHGDDASFNPSIARQDQDLWRQYLDNLADQTVRLCNMSQGRALVLFTSRAVMNGVYDRMTQRNRYPGRLPWPVLKQGDASVPVLTEAFKSAPSILLGLKSFWEGFDVPGPMLSLVVICGIPFTPPTDPVYAARCELAQIRHGRGAHFRKIAVPEATVDLKQGFGRGKRTDSDRAVVAILDTRMRTAGYGRRIIASLPDAPLTDDDSEVYRFFR